MPTFPEPPNRKSVVETVYARGGFDITTHDGCGRLVEAVLPELDALDPGEWFHLKKSPGQNRYNGHAVDGGVHGPTGYFIDFIGSSASPNAKIAWSLDRKSDGGPRYKGRTDLFLPARLDGSPTPVPQPPADTHRYDGGGNDTGTCDRCGQLRSAAVHQTPESQLPHSYDGGEQDTGLCDICGQPRDGVLHGSQPTPVPVPVPPTAPRLAYSVWLQHAQAIGVELVQHRGGYAPTDLAHFLYGLVEEGRTLDAIVKEIRG